MPHLLHVVLALMLFGLLAVPVSALLAWSQAQNGASKIKVILCGISASTALAILIPGEFQLVAWGTFPVSTLVGLAVSLFLSGFLPLPFVFRGQYKRAAKSHCARTYHERVGSRSLRQPHR